MYMKGMDLVQEKVKFPAFRPHGLRLNGVDEILAAGFFPSLTSIPLLLGIKSILSFLFSLFFLLMLFLIVLFGGWVRSSVPLFLRLSFLALTSFFRSEDVGPSFHIPSYAVTTMAGVSNVIFLSERC